MLLSEYLAARGLLPMDAPAASSLAVIRAFLFGEEYTVELTVEGKVSSYRFDSLLEALDVLKSEFEKDERFNPQIEIVSYSKTRDPKFGQLPQLVAAEKKGFVPIGLDNRVAAAIHTFTANVSQVPSFGPAPDRVLAVTLAERNMAFPRAPIEFYTEDIEKAVTYYSITNTWDQLNGASNL